mmetsp:Transcript_4088/g.14636  ORF Transcript_4088/g.14636 Transcript_4088/m.14636 type:complete len:84 (+) Transcript_4088:773-1024(+)
MSPADHCDAPAAGPSPMVGLGTSTGIAWLEKVQRTASNWNSESFSGSLRLTECPRFRAILQGDTEANQNATAPDIHTAALAGA